MKKLISIMLIFCMLAGLTACQKGAESSSGTGSSAVTQGTLLDRFLTAEEQKEYSDFIDGIDVNAVFENDTLAWGVYYCQDMDALDKLTEVGIKGAPVLITKSIEIEEADDTSEEGDTGLSLAMDRLFAFSAICRVSYADLTDHSNSIYGPPSLDFYYFASDAGFRLPRVAYYDDTAESKLDYYREYGIFAVPYVIEDIEKGYTELEKFFPLIGAHLTAAEYLKITEYTDATFESSPLTKEEIDAKLLSGTENFDWRAWYEENKDDLNDLYAFAAAYCAEYEAETAAGSTASAYGSLLDRVLTAEEQQKQSDFIDGIYVNAVGSTVHYYADMYGFDKLSEVGINGAPVLVTKSIEMENVTESVRRTDSGLSLAMDRLFAFSAICRISFGDFMANSNNVWKPSQNYYNFYSNAKYTLSSIASSDRTDKLEVYRKYGILAVPYVIEDIEEGNTELEKFFSLIGAHLTTAEYLKITEYTDITFESPRPTQEEIDAALLSGAENFDWRAWYEENKEDINNLVTFLDAYCAEYEA